MPHLQTAAAHTALGETPTPQEDTSETEPTDVKLTAARRPLATTDGCGATRAHKQHTDAACAVRSDVFSDSSSSTPSSLPTLKVKAAEANREPKLATVSRFFIRHDVLKISNDLSKPGKSRKKKAPGTDPSEHGSRISATRRPRRPKATTIKWTPARNKSTVKSSQCGLFREQFSAEHAGACEMESCLTRCDPEPSGRPLWPPALLAGPVSCGILDVDGGL